MSDESSPDESNQTTIKLAAKEASQRASGPNADPGPGDPNAAPSEAPMAVDLPDAPTPSQLVVKSSKSSADSPTSALPVSAVASQAPTEASMQGSSAGPAASNPSLGAPREPTSSAQLTGPERSRSHHSSMGAKSTGALGAGTSKVGSGSRMKSSSGFGAEGSRAVSGSRVKSSGGLAAEGARTKSSPGSRFKSGSGLATEGSQARSSTGRPTASGMRTTTGMGSRIKSSGGPSDGPKSSPAPRSPDSPSMSPVSGSRSPSPSTGSRSPSISPSSPSSGTRSPKHGHKVTKFRYHKRITVRTKGKTDPSTVMHKVNEKDRKAGITPSTIEDMDPEELMKRAGIKGNKKTHWRIRLRQTKRTTKGGKTFTQTKVAYRDSAGNKRVKTSPIPYCTTCNKNLEECNCSSSSKNQ